MKTHNRIVVATVGVLLVILVSGAFWFDWNRMRGLLSNIVSERSGRTLTIDGDLSVNLSMTPVITLNKIKLSNADWAATKHMVEIETLTVSIQLWELLRGRVVLPRLELLQPVLDLEKNEGGLMNWQFDEGIVADTAVPDERSEFPVIGRLAITDGEVRYRDATRDFDFSGAISTVAGSGADNQDNVELTAQGSLQERPFAMEMHAGSLLDLRDEEQLYPVQLKLHVADTQLSIKGTLDRPLQFRGLDLELNVEGPDLSRLYVLTGTALPGTPPYVVSGQLHHRDGIWRVAALEGRIGDSDIAGSFEVNTSQERYLIKAALTSEHLDFDDLAPLVGAPPSASPGETISTEQAADAKKREQTGKVIPDQQFDLTRLRNTDAEFSFNAENIIATGVPLEHLELELQLHEGRMTIDPLQLGLAGGEISGRIALDATQAELNWDYGLALRQLKIGRLVAATSEEDIANGTLNGRIDLHSHGNSMHETAAHANGDIELSIAGGQISNLLIEIVGLDVAESLGLILSDTEQGIPLRCARGKLTLNEGVLDTQLLVIDTQDTLIESTLHANLENESYTLTLLPQPKDGSPFSVRAPLHVEGSFRELNIRPDFGSLGLRAGAAVALGTVATPVAALLAFIEPGAGENIDCENLDENP